MDYWNTGISSLNDRVVCSNMGHANNGHESIFIIHVYHPEIHNHHNYPFNKGCFVFFKYHFLTYPQVNKHNYGKSPFLMGKFTIISMGHFQQLFVCFPEGTFPIDFPVAVLRLEAAVSQLFTRLAQEIEDLSSRKLSWSWSSFVVNNLNRFI